MIMFMHPEGIRTRHAKAGTNFRNQSDGPNGGTLGKSLLKLTNEEVDGIDNGLSSIIRRPSFGSRLSVLTDLDIQNDGFIDFTGYLFVGKGIGYLPEQTYVPQRLVTEERRATFARVKQIIDILVPRREAPNISSYTGYHCFKPVRKTAKEIHEALHIPMEQLNRKGWIQRHTQSFGNFKRRPICFAMSRTNSRTLASGCLKTGTLVLFLLACNVSNTQRLTP